MKFQCYLTANEITNNAKAKATFLSLCAYSTFENTQAFVAPQELDAVSFITFKAKLKNHIHVTRVHCKVATVTLCVSDFAVHMTKDCTLAHMLN
ncbi:UNVERIFIED_CONTAM: hypothetical protein K2H54_074699 [Gekko kuhli]